MAVITVVTAVATMLVVFIVTMLVVSVAVIFMTVVVMRISSDVLVVWLHLCRLMFVGFLQRFLYMSIVLFEAMILCFGVIVIVVCVTIVVVVVVVIVVMTVIQLISCWFPSNRLLIAPLRVWLCVRIVGAVVMVGMTRTVTVATLAFLHR